MTGCAWRWKSDADLTELAAEWARERAAFEEIRREALLY